MLNLTLKERKNVSCQQFNKRVSFSKKKEDKIREKKVFFSTYLFDFYVLIDVEQDVSCNVEKTPNNIVKSPTNNSMGNLVLHVRNDIFRLNIKYTNLTLNLHSNWLISLMKCRIQSSRSANQKHVLLCVCFFHARFHSEQMIPIVVSHCWSRLKLWLILCILRMNCGKMKADQVIEMVKLCSKI